MPARRGIPGALRVALVFAGLLASLSLVVRRQSRALTVLRGLGHIRSERAMAEAEKADLEHRIQQLESRPRVVAEARKRFGMHVPTGNEIVILPLTPGSALPTGMLARGRIDGSSSGEGGEAEPGGADARRAVTLVGGQQ